MRNPAQDGSIRVGLGTGGSGMKAWGLSTHAARPHVKHSQGETALWAPPGPRRTLGIGKERKRGVTGGGGAES